MGLDVVVTDRGGNRVLMSTLAETTVDKFSSAWADAPGGFSTASWTMNLPATHTLGIFTPGNAVQILDGPAVVWEGRLTEPERGEPWQFHATGRSTLADTFLALKSTGLPTSTTSTAVSYAITRGLPWTVETHIGNDTDAPEQVASAEEPTKPPRLRQLLDAYAANRGQRWAVWEDGRLVFAADPTTPKWVLRGGPVYMGVAEQEYVTKVIAVYVSAVSGTPPEPSGYSTVSADNGADLARWGTPREEVLDLTGLGLMDSLRAARFARERIALLAARTGWTAPLLATEDTLFTPLGIPARLTQVRAGDMVRVENILDSQGNYVTGGYADVVLAGAEYNAGERTATLTPVGLVARDWSALLTAAAPARTEAPVFLEVA